MAHKKLQATATLFLDTSNAQSDAKRFVSDIKQKLAEVETAADKMSVFKDVVGYIAQIDRALTALKAKNADAFNSVFGGLDTDLKKQLEGIFGIDGTKLGQLDVLRKQLENLTPKSSITDIRNFAKAINSAFKDMELNLPFEDIDAQFAAFTKEAKAGHIEKLKSVFAEFATVWSDVTAKVSGGFGVGGGSGSGGGFGGPSKEIQKEIDRLKKQKEEYQQVIDAINKKPVKINITAENDSEELEKLINAYRDIQKKTTSNDFTSISFEEQNKLLAERVRLATLLKNTSDHIIDNDGSEDAFTMATTGEGMRAIESAEAFLDDFSVRMQSKSDQIQKIYKDLIAGIEVELNQLSINNFNMEPTRNSITNAIEMMVEANRIMGELDYDSPNMDLLDDQLDSIINKIKTLATTEEQVQQLDELLGDNRDAPEYILDELCNILAVNIPKSAEKAKDTIDGITGSNNQPSKQNISILAKQLQEIYNIGRQIGDNEIGFAVDVDGAAYFVQSADHMVKVADEASVAVRALNESLTILGHTHPNGGGLFSAGDYRSAISQKRSGMNMPVVAVGSNAASVLNLDGVDEKTLGQIEHVLDRFKDSDDAVGPSVVKELQNILSENGFTDALQVVDISNGMDGLSEALLKLSMNATEVHTPLQKLQSLIQYYSSNKLGADNLAEFAEEWKEFESGAKSASEVFDNVMHKLGATDLEGNYFNTSEKEYENLSTSLNMIKPSAETATTAITEAENKLKSFLELCNKIQGNNLTEFYDDRDNVTIGRYTERLEVAKEQLDQLGKQGLITADELKEVEEAYNISKSRLELETSNYTGYGSGYYDYTYYDDYNQEKSKNEDLENELSRKEEKIAELSGDKQKQATEKLNEFHKMASEVSHGTASASFDDVEIGEYTARLQDARLELEQFYQDQLITADAMEEVNKVFDVAQSELSEAKLINHLNTLDGYTSEENLRAAEKEADALREDLTYERDRADQLAGDLAVAEDRARAAETKMYEAEERAATYGDTSSKAQKVMDDVETPVVDTEPVDTATAHVAEAIIENGSQAAIEAAQKPSAQDRRANVEAELESKKQRLKEAVTGGRSVEDELRYKNKEFNIPPSVLPGRDYSLDHLQKAHEATTDTGASLALDTIDVAKRLESSNDVAKALFQIARFPEKYGAIEDDKRITTLDDHRQKSNNLFVPLGNGKTVGFNAIGTKLKDGTSTAGTSLYNTRSVTPAVFDKNGNIVNKSFGYDGRLVTFDDMAKNTQEIFGMSFNEMLQLPVIQKAASDYVDQLNEDKKISGILSVAKNVPGYIDAVRPLSDKRSELLQQAQTTYNDIHRLQQEKQAMEQEISLESKSGQEEVKAVPKKAPAQTKVEKQGPTVFEDQNGQLALFDNISTSAQRAEIQVEKLEDSVKSVYALDNQMSMFDPDYSVNGQQFEKKQDKLVRVESELDIKKSKQKELATEIQQVENEFDNFLAGHGVNTRFLGQGRFIDPDHLHKAYKDQSLAFTDRRGVGDSDVAQALYQIARFPEKYGGTIISKEEGNQYYGDKRVNADAIIPFGDGIRVMFGTGNEHLGSPYKRNDQTIPKTINGNNDVIAGSNGGYISYEEMAKNPKPYLGMSQDELKQLPIIKRAYNDYQTQIDEDNVIRTLLQNLGDRTPEHVDTLRKLFDKRSGLRQEQLQNQENITQLTKEKQAIEQEKYQQSLNETIQAKAEDEAATEAQTDALREQSVVVEEAANTQKELEESLTSTDEPAKQDSIADDTSREGDITPTAKDITPPVIDSTPIQEATEQVAGAITDAGVDAVLEEVNTTPPPEIPTQPIQESAEQVAETIVEDASQAVVESVPEVSPPEVQQDALKDQVVVEEQISNADQPRDSDVGVINQENQALKEQLDIVQDISNAEQTNEQQKEPPKRKSRSKRTSKDDSLKSIDLKYIDDAKRKLTGSFNKLDLGQRQELQKEYEEAIITLDKYKNAVKDGARVELDAIDKVVSGVRDKIEAYKKVNKEVEQTKKKNSDFGSTAEINVKAKHNSLTALASNEQFANSPKIATALENYETAYNNFTNKLNELRNSNDEISTDEAANFKELTTECNNATAALEKIIKNTTKLKGKKANAEDYMLGADFVDNEEGRVDALNAFIQGIEGADAASVKFSNDYSQAMFTVDNGDGTLTQMTAVFTDAGNEIVALAGKTKEAGSAFGEFFNQLKGKFKSIFSYMIASFSFHEIWQVIKQGINYVREIDLALTELKKVTNETEATYNRFLQTASKTAGEIGSTVADFVNATADFARLGYNIDQAANLAEAASVYKNVGDGIDDITQASESIISTMKAFGIEANNAIGIVDRFNEVGNNFAISSTGIGEAMKRSASALYEAGNTIDESIALITAANSVIQNPEQVGTALKTLALRLRGAKVELEEAGEDVDGMAESTSQLQAKLLALTHGKVDIMLDENTFKNTTQILREMSGAWEEMTDIERAAALELMGGKRQANILSSVIKNFDMVEDVIETSMDSTGSAMRENETYLDSIQGRIDLFNNAVQTMWMNLIDSSMVKSIVDVGTFLVKQFDTLHGKIIAIVGALAIYKKFKDKTTFADMFAGAANTIKEVYSAIQTMTTATNLATKSDIARALASKGVNKELVAQIIAEAGLKGVKTSLIATQVKATAATLTEKYATHELTTAQYLAAMSTMGLKTALQGLWNVLKANPVYAIAAVIAAAALAFDHFHTTAQEAADAAKKAFDEIQSVIDSTKSTIQELETELSTLNDRIEELDGKELSFADNEELEKLKAQREELEHSLKVQEQLLELQQDAGNKQAIASMKAYTKAASEGADETQETAKTWGTISGVVAGIAAAAGIIAAIPTGGLSLGATAAGVGAMGIAGGVAGNKLGEAVGSGIASNEGTYDSWYKTYTKALDAARKDEQEALKKYEKDPSNIDKLDKWQEAQQRTAEIEKEMYNHLSQMQQYMNSLEYGVSDEIDAELDTWNNFLDKFSIDQGASGSEVTALDRIFGENASDEIQTIKEQILEAVKTGKDFDFTSAINGSQELKDTLDYVGLSAADVKNYFTQIGGAARSAAENRISPVQTYSSLIEDVESYNEILSQTSEIVSDNTKVSQEYKDSLKDIGLSSEEINECFDENNDLIVKNSDKLNKLVKKQREEYKNNVKTAKSQAKLKYYKLAKDLVNTAKNTKNLTNVQKDHIKAILEEMDAVQDTISKYTMLESELLGVTNAYTKLADAQEIDSATDYGSKAEEMVHTLANAFNTGELGTAAAEAAFEGLIPDWVVANAQSVDEAMESAYNYMKSGNLAGLFDIKYDDDGKLESVQMTLDKVKSFTGALIEADEVFHGTWDEFTLDPAINNLDDFANAIGVTKEVAFAYLTELERYDASNIFGDSATGLLDQLMSEDFDYVMQQASQKYAKAAADMAEEFNQVNPMVNMFDRKILYDDEGYMVTMASESFKASDVGLDGDFAFNVTPILPDGTMLEDVEDYIRKHLASGGKLEDMDIFLGSYATMDEAIAKGKRLSELQGIFYENQLAIEELENKALDFASAWGKTSDQLTDAREEAESLGRELAGAKDGVNESTGRTVEEIEADIKKNDQLISDLLSNLDKLKDEFGGEPTEMVVGVALDEVQEDIDNFKKDLEKKPAELKAAITEIDSTGFENLGLTKEADGSWSGLAELDWYQKLDPASKEEVINYLDMVESSHYLNLLMGDGVPTIEEHLARIVEILETVYSLQVNAKIDTTEVMSFRDWLALNPLVTTVKAYLQKAGNWLFGSNVNGTANVSGNAYAGGKWGAKQTETSLVGELGPEMVVRGNRWFTVGENGAEFTQVKKGDIIFNHKQTEQLLENGHITGRGKAYASGTAYAGIDTFTPYVPPVVSSGGNSDSDDDDDYDDIADDAEQVVDFIEMKLEEIEAIIEKTTTRIENFLDDTTDIKSKDELYDELVKAEKDKSEAYLKAAQKYNVEAAAALSGVPQKYQEMARNGAIAIKDFIGEDQVEIAEKIEEYRDWAAKADEAENGHLEAIAAISAHRVEQLEDIATDFENIISISKSHSDLLQAEMDFIEESGNRLSESYYEELKKHSQKQLDDMQDERVALQKILDDAVAAGDVIIGSDDWYSMLETIYEVDQNIIDCKTSLEEFQNAINELYWDNFDKFIAEIDNVNSELSNLYDLISDDDKIVDDMGKWTDDGITALGLLAQQMENAQFKAQEYGDAIDKLKKDYANGLYSTDEYNEKLADLTESQYSAIKSYEDAKDAIVDLNKTRAEAVKKYMQEEIDKYGELIEKQKESLNADKEARGFEKSVQESNKNIKDIERQIAALKGNTSSSAMAERKRLEAELLKAREELNDLYYDHSIEKQQEALDKELEDYTKNKEDQMDALDEYLEKEEQVISDSFDLIAENTKGIVDTLIGISEEYGITISDTVATPWYEGANAIGTYQEQLNTSVSATTANFETLKRHLEDLQTQADKTAESIVAATHSTVVDTNDGHQTSIKGYAKGSNGVEYDQWAILDELGEELQLVPNKSGRLDYIKKGTAILNNTLTDRLINLAMDPTSMLENSRPVIGAPGIATINNNISIDMSIAEVVHIDHADSNSINDITKAVKTQMDNYMRDINNKLRRK